MDSATLDGGTIDGHPGDRGRVDAGGLDGGGVDARVLDGGGVDAGPECVSTDDCGENESCMDERCVCELDTCDGSCVDLSSDPDHCGECSSSCVAWCEDGRCECAIDTDCPSGKTCCGLTVGVCADLASDPEHCGGCGAACAPGEWCDAGACTD